MQFEPGKGYNIIGLTSASLSYGKTETTTTFVYDSTGARVKKVAGSTTSVYLGKDYDITGSTSTKYIFLGDRRIANKDSSNVTLYYHEDHINSSNIITDSSGNKAGMYEYDPYGSTVTQTGSATVKHQFTGQEKDDSTALHYYNARYYDSQLGRFITPDTYVPEATNPQDLNRYTYANNNPIKYTDPTGHFAFIPFLIGVAVGAAIGAAVSGAVYTITALASGSWSWGNFGKAVGVGAIGGAISGGIGGAVQGAVSQNFAFSVLKNMAGYTAAQAAIEGKLTAPGVIGAFAGSLVGGFMPGFQGVQGGALKNVVAEIGYGTITGAISGTASGGVSAAIAGGKIGSGMVRGATAGALAGGITSSLQVGLFGPAYSPSEDTKAGVRAMQARNPDTNFDFGRYGPVYRTGGLMGKITPGIALGRNLYVRDTADTDAAVHETGHFYQATRDGYGYMLGKGAYEQWVMRPSGRDPYSTSGTQEYEADRLAGIQ